MKTKSQENKVNKSVQKKKEMKTRKKKKFTKLKPGK